MAASSRSGTRVVGMRANAWRCALRPIFVVSREGAEAERSALFAVDGEDDGPPGVSFAAGVSFDAAPAAAPPNKPAPVAGVVPAERLAGAVPNSEAPATVAGLRPAVCGWKAGPVGAGGEDPMDAD